MPIGTIGFINDVALLICMGFLYYILTPVQINEKNVLNTVGKGSFLDGMGIVVILNPWKLSPSSAVGLA